MRSRDGLGSVAAVTDEAGNVERRYAYDAWGKQTLLTNPAPVPSTSLVQGQVSVANPPTRGFTDLEMLSDFGLIHMNGRVYDPTVGRFVSADPFVQSPAESQSYNRYSYVMNNPLGATDPSGFFSLKEILPAIIAIAVTAVVVYLSAGIASHFAWGFWTTIGNAITTAEGTTVAGLSLQAGLTAVTLGGFAGGFASSFSGSLLNGGSLNQAFQAGLVGGAWGAVSALAAAEIGGFFKSDTFLFDKWAGAALAHGLADGAISEAETGNFRSGFFAGAFASAAAPLINKIGTDFNGPEVLGRTAAAAAIGGTASVIGGGKFSNGATTAAFDHLFNAEGANAARSRNTPSNSGSQATGVDPRAVTVQQAALVALGLLNPGQVETSNVLPDNANFAKVVDPTAINTSGWTTQPSIHGTALESPSIPGYPDYAVKLYSDPSQGNVIAVVYPTNTFTHYFDAVLYTLGIPVNTNIAKSFLDSKPPPPPPSGGR